MSLYTKRVSTLTVEGAEVILRKPQKESKAPKKQPTAPTAPTESGPVPPDDVVSVEGKELTIKAGDKSLKVSLSKDGRHLEIEYLKKSGVRKPESVAKVTF